MLKFKVNGNLVDVALDVPSTVWWLAGNVERDDANFHDIISNIFAPDPRVRTPSMFLGMVAVLHSVSSLARLSV